MKTKLELMKIELEEKKNLLKMNDFKDDERLKGRIKYLREKIKLELMKIELEEKRNILLGDFENDSTTKMLKERVKYLENLILLCQYY